MWIQTTFLLLGIAMPLHEMAEPLKIGSLSALSKTETISITLENKSWYLVFMLRRSEVNRKPVGKHSSYP